MVGVVEATAIAGAIALGKKVNLSILLNTAVGSDIPACSTRVFIGS